MVGEGMVVGEDISQWHGVMRVSPRLILARARTWLAGTLAPSHEAHMLAIRCAACRYPVLGVSQWWWMGLCGVTTAGGYVLNYLVSFLATIANQGGAL